MDLRKLKTLIDLVSESNISELEITEAEGKVRIVKGGEPAPVQYVQAVAAAPAALAPAAAGAPAFENTPAAVAASPAPMDTPLAPTGLRTAFAWALTGSHARTSTSPTRPARRSSTSSR